MRISLGVPKIPRFHRSPSGLWLPEPIRAASRRVGAFGGRSRNRSAPGVVVTPPASAPTIDSISPTSGPAGTPVTVSGTNFVASGLVLALTNAGGASLSPVLVNSTTLTGTMPAHADGAVDVYVETANGNDTLVGWYTYDSSDYAYQEGEPNYADASTSVLVDDFNYASIAAMFQNNGGGGPWDIYNQGRDYGSIVPGWTTGVSGYRIDWPEGGTDAGAQIGITYTGRVICYRFYYRAQAGFLYFANGPGKKHALLGVGVGGRWTDSIGWNSNLGTPAHSQAGPRFEHTFDSTYTLQQAGGNVDFDTTYPYGDAPAAGARYSNGSWHRRTCQYIRATVDGAADANVKLWLDGRLILNRTAAGTAAPFGNFELASTFNDGSGQAQYEIYSGLRIWVP